MFFCKPSGRWLWNIRRIMKFLAHGIISKSSYFSSNHLGAIHGQCSASSRLRSDEEVGSHSGCFLSVSRSSSRRLKCFLHFPSSDGFAFYFSHQFFLLKDPLFNWSMLQQSSILFTYVCVVHVGRNASSNTKTRRMQMKLIWNHLIEVSMSRRKNRICGYFIPMGHLRIKWIWKYQFFRWCFFAKISTLDTYTNFLPNLKGSINWCPKGPFFGWPRF